MPKGKYKPAVSKAQERLLFAKEAAGELAPGEARGKAHAAKVKAKRTGHPLPEHVGERRKR